MRLDKDRIKDNFNRASICYDDHADVQAQSAKILVESIRERFHDFHPSTILDLGTGTGVVPELLLKIFPRSHYHLNDIAPSIIRKAQEKFADSPQFTYEVDDMETMHFDHHDLIISNFAMQWLQNMRKMLTRCYHKSNLLAFTCLLAGTFKEWEDIFKQNSLESPLYKHPSKKEIDNFLLSLNPKEYFLQERKLDITFENPMNFVQYLRNLGAQTSSKSFSSSALTKILLSKKKLSVTYRVLFGLLRRR